MIINAVDTCLDGLLSDTKGEKEWYISLPVKSYIEHKAVESFIRAYLQTKEGAYSFTPLTRVTDPEFTALLDTPEHERKLHGFK